MFSCGFWKIFKTHFSKYIYGWLLLEKHWISLKKAPILIAMKVFSASYHKEFLLFFLRTADGNFVEISVESSAK